MKVVASKYFLQYIFSAVANAVIVPMINSVGSGIAMTIGMRFLASSLLPVLLF